MLPFGGTHFSLFANIQPLTERIKIILLCKIHFIIRISPHFSFSYHEIQALKLSLPGQFIFRLKTAIAMRKRRKFYRGITNHVYQRTVNGEQLFYCLEDCLVFYTILSVCARTAEIEVLELCIMHNHTHSLIKAPQRKIIQEKFRQCSQMG